MTSWFERYGIVGIYFLLLNVIMFKDGLGLNGTNTVDIAILIASIPIIGYIISICSQYIYYHCFPEKWQVHRRLYKELKKINNRYSLPQNEISDESKVEINLSIMVRASPGNGYNINLENRKLIMDFISKRFDVEAINLSIIFATLLSWLLWILFYFSLIVYICLKLLIIGISFVILIACVKSWWLMFDQILKTNLELFKRIRRPDNLYSQNESLDLYY